MKKKILYWIVLAIICTVFSACAGKKKEVTRLPSILASDIGTAEVKNDGRQNQAPTENVQTEEPEKASAESPQEAEPDAPNPDLEAREPEEKPDEEPDGKTEDSEEPTPEEEPAQPESGIDVARLQQALETELASCTGHWALYWKCLDTGETISLNNGPMVAASLIKLFVAGAWYDAVEQGEVEDSPELVRTMISDSSNDACNQLIDRLGGGDAAVGMEIVTRFAESVGCADSQLNRKMLEASPLENYTSVEDCGKVLEKVYTGEYVSQSASSTLLEYLEGQTRTTKIPAGVPWGTRTANKTGELASVENDAAIIWAPGCTYILCVMSDDILNSAAGQGNIAGLSKIVYEFLAAPE